MSTAADHIDDLEPEVPVEVADSILSWTRVVSKARSENLPDILRHAARDLFGTRDKVTNSETHAVVTQAIGDALVDWAREARIDDDEAQRIFAEAAAADERQPEEPDRQQQRSSRLPPLMSSAAFCKSFVAPDPLIEGIIMRGFIYALTAHTGKGKTAVALLIAYCIAEGRRLGELEVEKGRVLFLAGENPVDVQMRWIAMSQQLDFDRETIDVTFIDRRFKFSECMEDLLVDSSFAFFEGDNENDNPHDEVVAAGGDDLRGRVA